MALRLTVIGTPLHAHAARTPGEYLDKQREHLRQSKQLRPDYAWGDPTESKEQIEAFVSGGRWVVMCCCGNAPSASPEWSLACCFECGLIYRDIVFPRDREAVEQAMLAQPMHERQWIADHLPPDDDAQPAENDGDEVKRVLARNLSALFEVRR